MESIDLRTICAILSILSFVMTILKLFDVIQNLKMKNSLLGMENQLKELCINLRNTDDKIEHVEEKLANHRHCECDGAVYYLEA